MIGHNYSYNGNPRVKKTGVEQPFSENEVAEYVRCMNTALNIFVRITLKLLV